MLRFFEGCDIVLLPDAPAPGSALRERRYLLACDPSMPALPGLAQALPGLGILTPNRDEARERSRMAGGGGRLQAGGQAGDRRLPVHGQSLFSRQISTATPRSPTEQ